MSVVSAIGITVALLLLALMALGPLLVELNDRAPVRPRRNRPAPHVATSEHRKTVLTV